MLKKNSGTCSSYVSKWYKCAEEGCEQGTKREGTVADFLEPFWSKMIKNRFKKSSKKRSQKKHWIWCQMGSQNGIKIDAKTHRKSMPKLVTKRIRKIIKNHVSLNGKSIEIHLKNKCFWCFRRLPVRTGKVSKNIKSDTKIHPKIDTKIMLEKVMQQI